MTYSINQNQRIPANYSGVTINVTNPSLSSYYPAGKTCPQQAQVYHQPQAQYEPVSYPAEYYINNYNQQSQAYSQPQQTVIPQANQEQAVSAYANRPHAQYQQPQTINQQVYNNYPMPNQQLQISPQDSYNPAYNQPQATQQIYYPQQPQLIYPRYDYEQEQNLNSSKEVLAKLDKLIELEQAEQKNKAKKEVVVLTNEYIMSLENFLNNPNKEIRRKGASEVINRLGEDKSRYNDAALNALLNKMVQDPDKGVRTLGISAFSAGLASGNEYTVQLLKHMEANPQLYPDDMEQVATALLKMSAATETIYVDVPPKK